MNTIKKIIAVSSLVLSLGAFNNFAVAAQAGTTQSINNTTAHLEMALSAVKENDLKVAQEHINAARQSSKEIIGGTYAPAVSRGSDAILKARRNVKEGNTDGTAAALKEALEIFNSMHSPAFSSQGGLK